MWAAVGPTGCRSAPYNRVELSDLSPGGSRQLHHEQFEKSYYRVGEGGSVDLVLWKETPRTSGRSPDITQVIHVRPFWKPLGGRTHAEGSMLNADICYAMLRGSSGISYEGGGFFEYAEDADDGVITGKLEGADLQPLRRCGGDMTLFERAGVAGRFRAVRDDRRTTRIINDIERRLGPPPPIQPDHRGPDY